MAQIEEISAEKKVIAKGSHPEKQSNEGSTLKEKAEEKSLSTRSLSFLKELLILVITAFILAFIFKTFVVQPFKVEMSSMVPTVMPNDRVLVNKFVYRFTNPKRGDIVTLYSPEAIPPDQSGFSIIKLVASLYSSPRKILIKRVIATEGETIEVREGKVFISNKPITEKYIKFRDFSGYGPKTVPKEYIFVMGDNRPNSKDSRSPDVGPIKESDILGKAFLVYWPPGAFKMF